MIIHKGRRCNCHREPILPSQNSTKLCTQVLDQGESGQPGNNASFFSQLTNGPISSECFVTLGQKGLRGTNKHSCLFNTFVSSEEKEALLFRHKVLLESFKIALKTILAYMFQQKLTQEPNYEGFSQGTTERSSHVPIETEHRSRIMRDSYREQWKGAHMFRQKLNTGAEL